MPSPLAIAIGIFSILSNVGDFSKDFNFFCFYTYVIMFKDLLRIQKTNLDFFFDSFNEQELDEILQLSLHCTGVLVFTGVGKSGIISQKISQTLLSTGSKSIFLPPTDALHGDIGILSENDVIFLLSKSGQTQELVQLVPYIKSRKSKIVAVVCEKNSELAKQADLSIYLPMQRELCPFNLAPTISTTVQLLFGDLLAVALMKAKGFSLDQYALNHPAGAIGKKLSLSVSDIMMKDSQVPLAELEDTLIDKLAELSSKKCGCLLIVDRERNMQGIFTDGDLRRGLENEGEAVLHKKLKDLMTSSFLSISPASLAWNALKKMEENPKKLISVLPVLDDNKVVGVLRMHDILQVGIR
jgi:arabinose-5-phosphate isomerase